MTTEIELPRRVGPPMIALIDDADLAIVKTHKWFAAADHRTFYAVAHHYRDGKRVHIRMHNLIAGALGIDHVDGNGLNNQRGNLRLATSRQNSANSRPRLDTSSRYKGVCWANREPRRRSAWQASIQIDGRDVWLGYFQDEAEAARAYDRAARDAFGEFANPNFPDEP